MTQIEKFRESTFKAKLTLQDEERLSCSICGSWAEGGNADAMWIFIFTDDGTTDTCCLTCAQIEPPDAFETDAA